MFAKVFTNNQTVGTVIPKTPETGFPTTIECDFHTFEAIKDVVKYTTCVFSGKIHAIKIVKNLSNKYDLRESKILVECAADELGITFS